MTIPGATDPTSASHDLPYPPTDSREAIGALISAAPTSHPRLLANAETFAALRQTVQTSPLHRSLADGVIAEAEALGAIEPAEREVTGRRLLSVSRQVLKRVITLGMAYQLTGNAAFAQRCQDEMMAAAGFADWNPSHYLDVAEMTLAMAIGYDWLYEQLAPHARDAIRTAILDKGVRLPAADSRYADRMQASNNWGQVCSAGMVAGALVAYEHERELAATIVHLGIHGVTRSMGAYAPDGGYPEGPGYWSYGTSFNVVLLASLESVLGSSFGLANAPGFSQTGAFPPMACGPSGEFFNYADGSAERSAEVALWWLAQRFARPDFLVGEGERLSALADSMKAGRHAGGQRGRLLPLALLWMDTDADPARIQMPLHWNSGGHVPIALHRSSWTDPNASFVGLKAGSPSGPHGQMDTGSFVLDADGVRWALDLGAEGYHGIEARGMNLWNSAQDSDRWTIFRQSNAGHNTLVIDGQLQVAEGAGEVVRFCDDLARAHSVIDMSSAYAGQAERAIRGVAMLSSGQILIQDELGGLAPGAQVRWGFITKGECEVPAGSEVALSQGAATLTVTQVAPGGVTWDVIDTETPRHEWDSPNPGTRMLAFTATAPASGDLSLAVLFTPGSCTEGAAGPPALASPLEW